MSEETVGKLSMMGGHWMITCKKGKLYIWATPGMGAPSLKITETFSAPAFMRRALQGHFEKPGHMGFL